MNLRALSLALASLLPLLPGTSAQAAGPKEVAVSDRSLWPHALATSRDFDLASRAESLVFAHVLGGLEARPEEFPTLLGVKQVNTGSVRRWLDGVKDTVAKNLRAGRAGCGSPQEPGCGGEEPTAQNVVKLGGAFVASLGPEYQAWLAMDSRFYGLYAKEQLRLAALFPSPTSEILTHGPGEVTGSDWPDRQFLLTFDDGPTPAGGGTDRLVTLLNAREARGVFFVVGDALASRLGKTSVESVQALYRGQCVGSHGQTHTSHQKSPTWKASLEGTRERIATLGLTGNQQVLFRPPYGQRSPELTQWLAGQGGEVMLWNIDSQDWNATLAPAAATDRVVTLMLLWRRGVILFHDVHNKVHTAVPRLLDFARDTGLTWKDCRTL